MSTRKRTRLTVLVVATQVVEIDVFHEEDEDPCDLTADDVSNVHSSINDSSWEVAPKFEWEIDEMDP